MKGSNIMSGLIDKQTAIEAFRPYAEYESNRSNAEWVKRIELVLSELPIEFSEIVRCKDCKYADNYNMCSFVSWYNHPDDFCSKGVRKKKEKEGEY